MDELLPEQVASGRLTVTGDVHQAVHLSEMALVCVGTPSYPDGSSNLVWLPKL